MNIVRIIIIILTLFTSNILAQDVVDSTQADSSEYSDSVYFENKRNYVGANISPLFTNAFGAQNKNVKYNFIYKRNYGDKNLRVSANYINIANQTKYLNYRTVSSTSTTIKNRYYNNWYKQYDIRFGFEEIKGSSWSRFHVGADMIFGYMQSYKEYNDYTLTKDTTGYYHTTGNTPDFTAYHDSYYLTAGLDVSFGFDWFLSEEIAITFQITPQFNYYFINKETLADPNKEYTPSSDFANFTLNYFDIMLFIKF